METKNTFTSEQPARNAPGPKPSKKLYSVAALLREREFAGRFETSTGVYEFTWAPKSATLGNGKLELTGNLSVKSSRGVKREVKGVRATLAAIQGGIGTVPAAIQARKRAANVPESGLPGTESTGEYGYAGVLYFRLAPIDAKALGMTVNLSSVQLNARLAPVSATERELQVIFSDLVAAISRDKPDSEAAAEEIRKLNQLLGRV
ncbi:MAG TPA: hypothetical protein VFD58_35910 [Blastocatellia bacterium]|nr:hypothetical protein [Blastocatellia bacterium]